MSGQLSLLPYDSARRSEVQRSRYVADPGIARRQSETLKARHAADQGVRLRQAATLRATWSAKPKSCRGCKRSLPRSAFQLHRGASDKLQNRCRECRAVDKRRSALTRRDQYLRTRFGITLEIYERLLALQDGGCGICGEPPTRRFLDVDHKHGTELIRGLLCSRCNMAIGLFGDDPLVCRRLVIYLERTRRGTK